MLHNARTLAPAPGKALVYVIRPTMLGALTTVFDVECEGKLIGSTSGKDFLCIQLEPGNRHFQAVGQWELIKPEPKKFSLQVEAGKTYYLEQKVKSCVVKPTNAYYCMDWEEIPESEARQMIDKCDLSRDCTTCK